jgi:hypothetical protein
MSLVVLATAWAAIARADPPPATGSGDPVAADALFREGRRVLESGDAAGACRMFAESYRLDPAAGTLLNLANCEESLGRIASAWEHFRRATEVLPPSDRRSRVAHERVAALEPRLPHLTIAAATPLVEEATILRDGVEMGTASLGVSVPVDPGDHTVIVRAPGRQDASFEVTLAEGEARTIDVRLGEPTERAPEQPLRAPPPVLVAGGAPWRPLGFVVLGVGAASLATAAVTGILALGRASVIEDPSHCDADLRCDAEGVDAAEAGSTLATVSTVGFVVGGVAAAAGVVMLLLPTERERPPVAQLRLRPEVASFTGLVADGTF